MTSGRLAAGNRSLAWVIAAGMRMFCLRYATIRVANTIVFLRGCHWFSTSAGPSASRRR
jgi:hypothetical protein